jgi:hypothetical protein
MRTTLTLDDDIAVLVERERRRSGRSLKEIINDALRAELERRDTPPKRRRRYAVRPMDLGPCRLPSLDNTSEALAYAEGEDFKTAL